MAKKNHCKDTTRNKIQTLKTNRKKLQFRGEVTSESGTTACIICSEIFVKDWIQCVSCGAGHMKTALLLREICYITNMIPTKDVKIHED
jgi:hypothetical protein